MRRSLALVIGTLAACGAGDADDTDECTVSVQFDPVDATGPGTITARATVTNGVGVLSYLWSVSRDSTDIDVMPRIASYRDVDFVADQPGVYHVELDVPGCAAWTGDTNVPDPGANDRTMRLRFTPGPGSDVPGQERVVTIAGGADYSLDVVQLDAGLDVPIVVRDDGGAIVPAYVRITSRATPDVFVELVTSAAGADRVQLVAGHADVLVVPLAGDHAPRLIEDWAPLVQQLVVDAGAVATGVVLDPAGAPLAGARVSLARPDGATPSTIATTGADGGFAVRFTANDADTFTVVPPASSGLPRLTAARAGLQLARPITIRYAATLVTRDLGGAAVQIAGAPASGGHATFAIDVPAAATLGDGVTSVVADGKHRDTVAVDATGHLRAYRASAAAGRVFLQAATGPGAIVLLDLTTAAPASLDGAAAIALPIEIVDDDGAPIADAQLRATLTGDLAHLGAAAPAATANAAGHATLMIAPGATYAVEVVDPRHAHAAAHVLAGAGTAPAPIVLPPAITITGELRRTGQSVGLPSAGVTALCYACSGMERTRPLGDAVTDIGGAFALVIPDPGAAP